MWAMTNQEGLLAYGRLSEEQPHAFKISQMVVRPDMQGKGLGSPLVRIFFQENSMVKPSLMS
ncbi:GNAT family N-acetyltransferase [Enterovibrio calviensis]|uniref:GNAT family N-acetyltransferase n=1 Tax=Enterovibrio calviensis TaxID=91359 RepID=UPI0037354913